jgi:hypothetical protein
MANVQVFRRHEHSVINSQLIVRAALIETEAKLFNKRPLDVEANLHKIGRPSSWAVFQRLNPNSNHGGQGRL